MLPQLTTWSFPAQDEQSSVLGTRLVATTYSG
jgi:hypothetical protein